MKVFLSKISPRLYMAFSGLLLGFTLIFAKMGALSYFALIPLAYALLKRAEGEYRAKRAYLDGFIFYMCLDLVAFHWFTYFYPLDFIGLTNAQAIGVIALAWIGLSALQSVFSALVFVAISRFFKTAVYKKYPILLAPFAASLFAVNEWTQTFTWAGVPWARIAISQTEMPIMMQTASLFGSYFLTFIVVLFNFLFALAIFKSDKRMVAAVSALCVLWGNIAVGTILYFIPQVDDQKSVKVASVQGNIESQATYISFSEIYRAYEEQTRRAAEDGAELVVWPEGTFSDGLDSKIKPTGSVGYFSLDTLISDLAEELDVTIVVGSLPGGVDDTYNVMSVFYADGTSIDRAYAKRRPVPFGEYLPMKDFINSIVPVLGEINAFEYDVIPGDAATVFPASKEENAILVGTLICFDSIYEQLAIDTSRVGAEIIIIPSNDSWFYDSRALNMHHSQDILRAVEQGKYVVSCANSGLTSIVSDKGEIVEDMPIFEEGYIVETVYASSGRTLYSYIGNLFVYLCIAAALTPFALEIIRKIRKKA